LEKEEKINSIISREMTNIFEMAKANQKISETPIISSCKKCGQSRRDILIDLISGASDVLMQKCG
jgi:hypothetical protein